MDLQFLPHIVVINPHIKQVIAKYKDWVVHALLHSVWGYCLWTNAGFHGSLCEICKWQLCMQIIRYMALPAWRNANAMQVYDAYYHAFSVLRDMHPVTSFEDNAQLDILLRRLLDEHGWRSASVSLPMQIFLSLQAGPLALPASTTCQSYTFSSLLIHL